MSKTIRNRVLYDLKGTIAYITFDDGKVNAMSTEMLKQLHAALDKAEADGALVVLSGRQSVFSAGFDLKTFSQNAESVVEMMRLGAELAERILSFPKPVVVACTGHALAMGAFLLMAADVRIGVVGDYKIAMNEVAIGLTVPYFALEIARQRLTPAAFNRSVTTAYLYPPKEAVEAGYLDFLVPEEELAERLVSQANSLAGIDLKAHKATKLRARNASLLSIRAAIESELTLEQAETWRS